MSIKNQASPENIDLVFRRELSIAIPASLVSDIPHLREKTLRIGMIGRAAAIFGVEKIIVFSDVSKRDQRREINLIATILSYMETPQYLRKLLFKIRPELRYVGVLPPLRTPHHPLANHVKDLVDGEYREGAAASHARDGTFVDVGVEHHALVRNRKIPLNTRLTVKITKRKKLLEAEVANRNEIKEYWGYRVTSSNARFGKLLKTHAFDMVIATSKYGKPFHETSGELINRWETSRRILVAFGAPTQGLYEIVKQENLDLDDVADFVVNTIPRQRVETVRTEEALYVTLGILNLVVAKG
jgi:predicted SPOUT superfamily RNA methylase MTH1